MQEDMERKYTGWKEEDKPLWQHKPLFITFYEELLSTIWARWWKESVTSRETTEDLLIHKAKDVGYDIVRNACVELCMEV